MALCSSKDGTAKIENLLPLRGSVRFTGTAPAAEWNLKASPCLRASLRVLGLPCS
jgi:hypothetical protein